MKLIKLSIFDIKRGFREERSKFLFTIIVCVAMCFLMHYQLHNYLAVNHIKGDSSLSWFDYLFYNLKGDKVYSYDEQFRMPANWICNQVLVALIVGYYPIRDLSGYGKNTLVRSQSRVLWFTSKIILTVILVVLFYITIYCTTLVFGLFDSGNVSTNLNIEVTNLFYQVDISDIYMPTFIVYMLVVPLLTSMTISIVQVVLSFVVNPFISLVLIIGYFTLGTYYDSPFLIGNFSQIFRSKFFNVEDGRTMEQAFLYLGIIAVVFLVFGYIYFSKKDILNKN